MTVTLTEQTADEPVAVPRRGPSFLARAFGITAVLSVAGSALGLLRDLLLARFFGADKGTDAFLVSWTVPETAAPLLIEDAMAFLMVPAFSLALVLREERPEGPDPVRQLTAATLPWLLAGLCTLSGATALWAAQVVHLLAPGSPSRRWPSPAPGSPPSPSCPSEWPATWARRCAPTTASPRRRPSTWRTTWAFSAF